MWIINEVQLLRFDTRIKPSPISEGVTEIRISIHLAREKPNNTTYARSLGPYVWLTFAKSLWGQNHFSTLGMKSWFHSDCPTAPSSWATSFSLQQPPYNSGYGLTKQLQKLLGLQDPINPACVSTIQCLFHKAQHDAILNLHGWGLPSRSPKYLLTTLTHPIQWNSTCWPLVSSSSLKLRILSTFQHKTDS
jgi:hypothetical protein